MLTLPNILYPLFLFAALVVVVALVVLVIRLRTPLAGWGGLFSLALALHMLSYFFILTSTTPSAIQFWYRILIFAISSQTITWLLFVIVFSSRAHWITWHNIIIAWAIPMLAVYLLFGKSELNLLLLSHNKEVVASLAILPREIGWFGNLFITYTFGLQFLAIGLLIKMLLTATKNFRSLILTVSLGNTFTILAPSMDLLAIYPFAPFPNLQFMCIVISILVFFVAFLLSAEGLLPTARARIFEEIQDAVLVLDHHNNLIDMNPSGAKIIGKSEATALGRPISMVWPQGADLLATQTETAPFDGEHPFIVNGLEMTFDVNISPALHPTSRERIGQVMVLRNVTGRERMEKALQEHAKELTRTNKLITALSMVASRLGAAVDSKLVLDTLGTEMRKLGLDCGVVSIDPAGEIATIRYVSYNPALLQVFEKIAGFTLVGYDIPKQYWPSDRLLNTKASTWYSDPKALLRGLFAKVPEGIVIKARQLFGIQSIGQMCILPLISEEKVIGAMPIWGVDLQQDDSPILDIFASQVASILQKATAYESEIQRADELARSNTMILALSKVASQLQSSSNSEMIFETVRNELKKMGLDSMVGILDDGKQNMYIQYVSVNQDVIHWAEKLIGRRVSELTIPRHLWPTQKVVDEKSTHWDSMKSTLNIFPAIPESLQRTVLTTAGINLDNPVCFLPIATEQEVIGVLSIWGADLRQSDVPALSILANQVAAAIRNSDLFETEARRARELDILLKASEATSSSLDLDTVLLTLATQLLELSGFESCYISEWDKEANLIHGRVDHSRVFWVEEKRDAYSLSDYPQTKQVLLTGNPIILQGDFEAEEKQWMEQLGRAAVAILALYGQEKVIGLVEIAMAGKNKLFTSKGLQRCEEFIINAAPSLIEPLSANEPQKLFTLQEKLLQVSGGDICSFSEWDRSQNRVLTCAVVSDQISVMGQNPGINPERDASWKLALEEGKTSVWVHSEGNERIEVIGNGTSTVEVESLILFPLQKGDERIGLIELYDFNHKTRVSTGQLTLLRAIADKAGYWIENARLLQQTQKRLEEQTELLHEKEVLLKEIHHRVKNNLQVISSLLNLQSSRVTDFQTIQTLRDSQSRVRSMALIHEKLYQSQSLAKIDFGEYVKSLANDLFRSYRQSFTGVQLNVQTDEVFLELDQAIPCGLILNELITNALKYAFPDGRNGIIKVELRTDSEHNICLRVADDGVGIPLDFDILNAKSLGLQLVNSLVAQLDGRLELGNSQGTDYLVSFRC